MQKISYLKIQNFKVFGNETTIHFDNPTILIGANNAGKTTAIQALALWSWSVRIWYEKKSRVKSPAERNKGVALNRLEIAQVPIKEIRYFWNNARVRQNSNDNIGLTIKAGIVFEGKTHEVGILLKYHSADLMYCQPTEDSFKIDGLLEYANNLKINLLYPMSGIGEKEYVLQENAIRTQIGIGQTATIIRNICYHLYENDKADWLFLSDRMKQLFGIELEKPFVRATGSIELLYNYSQKAQKTDYPLDITLAGRGQQQMLLVLAYLLANKNAVLMIDEPDAHLEILRQTQIFTVLRDIAQRYNCQIIIVTHSEIVLNEANSVVFLNGGQAQEISDKNEFKFIKDALRNYGIQHYYTAKLVPRILYIESSTDKDMLMAFAQKFGHPIEGILKNRLNVYYTQNETNETSLTNELDRKSGDYKPYKAHFQAIKAVIGELKGVAIFDSDGKNRKDEITPDLAAFYWKQYEIENYFITPQTVLAFAQEELSKKYGGLFSTNAVISFEKSVEKHLIQPIFENIALYNLYQQADALGKSALFNAQTKDKKMSLLLENVFEHFAKGNNESILLSKGNFHLLIHYLDILPIEVGEKLDKIAEYLAE